MPPRPPHIPDVFRGLPSRREVLAFVGFGTTLAVLPGCHHYKAPPFIPPTFFTDPERRAMGALADAVIPPLDGPGGAALGAVQYIEKLLCAFEYDIPAIWAGGPYSGRAPYVDGHGQPGTLVPAGDFRRFLELDRQAELAWKLFLYGSDGVPGGGPNDATQGKVVGLRDQLRQGLAKAMAAAPAPLETLDAAGLAQALRGLDPAFQGLVIGLVCDGVFAAPEYGGNPFGAAWEMVHFEGDSQPLGYSLYDASTQQYRERPESPMTTANPGPDPDPMDGATKAFLSSIVRALGGWERP